MTMLPWGKSPPFTIFFFFNDTATTEIYTLSYTTLFRSPTSVARPVRWTSFCNRWSPRHCNASRRSEEHTSELQSRLHLVCRLLLEKKNRRKAQADRLVDGECVCVATWCNPQPWDVISFL